MNYNWFTVLSVVCAVPLAGLATPFAPLWRDIRVKHTWNTIPANWESLGPPPSNATFDLYISLKPHRKNALIEALYEVSDPEHQKYGAYMSQEQVADLVAPHQETLELVHSWLDHHGVPTSSISRSHGGGWLTITGVPVSQANEMLCASYQIYKLTGTTGTERILRTVSYSLPTALHAHVQAVAPTTLFVSPRASLQTPRKRTSEEAAAITNMTSSGPVKALSRRNDPPPPDTIVRPPTLRAIYNTEAYVPAAGGYNAIGILGLENEYPNQADLTKFMDEYRKDALAATFRVVPVNGGGNDPTHPGAEANVDIQYCSIMSYPTPQYFFSTGGLLQWSADDGLPARGDPYLVWLNYLINLQHIPPTITISYANPEPMFPFEYASTICELFAQLGLRGVSVLTASGDKGVGEGDCRDSSGNVQFRPMFPATCPYVTSVGGTMNPKSEIAMFLSGGGFSRYFPREAYQAAAVPSFLQNLGNQYANFYNPNGRGVPDLSSQAHELAFILANIAYVVSGTSCSTPTVAGIVSLLNDFQISRGRFPLGFLNPWLYGNGRTGFNDITSGNAPGCDTEGFTAISGWDPVTGLGTPDFLRLQLLLPEARPVV